MAAEPQAPLTTLMEAAAPDCHQGCYCCPVSRGLLGTLGAVEGLQGPKPLWPLGPWSALQAPQEPTGQSSSQESLWDDVACGCQVRGSPWAHTPWGLPP